MPISKNNLRKLGFGGSLLSNNDTQFIDDNAITHKQLQKIKLDIINDGTLKKPKPQLVIKELIESSDNFENYKIHHIPIQKQNYYSELNFDYPLIGQLTSFLPPNNFENFKDNGCFNSILLGDEKEEPFLTDNETYCDFVFESGASNSKFLSGISQNITGKMSSIVISSSNNITGKSFKSFFNYKHWIPSNTSGISNINYSNYYLPFPLSVYSYNYNAYNIPLKISTLYPETISIRTGENPLNGLLIISTGNGISSKICYISEHGFKTGYQNTYVYGTSSTLNPINNITGYKKISKKVSAKTLTIGSEYYTGNIFYKTGITFSNDISGFNNYVSGITGIMNPYKIDENQHIKQELPIKDTLFYKFYSGLYTGSKTFNTGVWNGIIPTGVNVQVEIISTEINKTIGTKYPLYFIYSGYGSNDQTDAKCTKYLNSFSYEGQSLLKGNFLIDNNLLKIKGRGYGENTKLAYHEALKNATYSINSKISNILKKYISEFIKINHKYKKFMKFVSKYRG